MLFQQTLCQHHLQLLQYLLLGGQLVLTQDAEYAIEVASLNPSLREPPFLLKLVLFSCIESL
jgi:hypothetical protein